MARMRESLEQDRHQEGVRRASQQGNFRNAKVRLFMIVGGIGALVLVGFGFSFLFGEKALKCDIGFCETVELLKDAKDCSGAVCVKCKAGYKEANDGTSYCGLDCPVEQCAKVNVPRKVTKCDDPEVTCQACNADHTTFRDEKGLYCGYNCTVEKCIKVSVKRGTTSCAEKGMVSCENCVSGLTGMADDKGAYCGPICPLANCKTNSVPRGAVDCTVAKCAECNEGWERAVDGKLEFTGSCQAMCTTDQIRRGCEKNSCTDSSRCERCTPGYTHDAGKGWCIRLTEPKLIEFYMYRASRSENYHPENIDLASAGGVMWYLHNEVVRLSCPRHYDITRVLRYKVKVKNTQQVWNTPGLFDGRQKGHQFGKFTQFDYGRCTIPDCPQLWNNKGYHVGCQDSALQEPGKPWYTSRYSVSTWYSLPGRCPSKRFDDPGKMDCAKTERGGECPKPANLDPVPGDESSFPTGASDCTWRVEEAGEVSVDELSGITDYAAFCAAKNREYDPDTDRGTGINFWDNKTSEQANAERTRVLLRKFLDVYPQYPYLPDPVCDGF